MPKITVATWFTLARIAMTPFFAYALAAHQAMQAFLLFGVACLTDTADGLIARRFGQKSDLGAVLDALADKLLLTVAYILMAVSPGDFANPIPVWLAACVILRDGLILLGGAWLRRYRNLGVRQLPPTVWGKWSTTFQMVTVVLSLVGNALRQTIPYFLFVCLITLGLTLFSGIDYLQRALTRGRLDAAGTVPADGAEKAG